MTENSQTSKARKRGRKLTDPDTYHFESEKKINKLMDKLKNDKNLSSQEKQKIRNQISAQRSRQNKKQETMQFESQINYFKKQFKTLTEVLNTRI